MSIEIKLTFATVDEAIAYLQGKPTAAAVVEHKPAATKPGNAKPAGTPAAAAPSAPETPAASTASSSAPETPAADLDYEKDIKPLIIKVGAVKGRDTVTSVMSALGVAKGPELKPAQFADAKAALEAALGA